MFMTRFSFISKVLVKFFNRAIMWEKEQHHPCVAISGEREDVQILEGKAGEIGILSSQGIGTFPKPH